MSVNIGQQLRQNLARYAEQCAAAGWPVHIEALPQVLEKMLAYYRPLQMYAFGSLVSGSFGPDSDLDLFLVIPDDAGPERRSAQQALRLKRETGIPMDILLTTASGFEERRHWIDGIDSEVAQEGVLLHGG